MPMRKAKITAATQAATWYFTRSMLRYLRGYLMKIRRESVIRRIAKEGSAMVKRLRDFVIPHGMYSKLP